MFPLLTVLGIAILAMKISDCISTKLSRNFRVKPIRTGTLIGFLAAGGGFLGCSVLAVGLYITDCIFPMGGGSGWSLLTGFLIGPLVAFAGMPWDLSALSGQGVVVMLLGMMAGVLLNGSILGFVVGFVTRLLRTG
ncbi:MAG: hypothetical protein ACYC7I_07125 [Gammaproteobacteria bacterium]